MRHCRTIKITPERGLWREVVVCDRIIVRRNRFPLNAILMIDFFSQFLKDFLIKAESPPLFLLSENLSTGNRGRERILIFSNRNPVQSMRTSFNAFRSRAVWQSIKTIAADFQYQFCTVSPSRIPRIRSRAGR